MELYKIPGYFEFYDMNIAIVSFLVFSIYTFISRLQDILQWYKTWRKRPPGPIGVPYLGYLPFIGKEPHKTLWNMRKKYGDVISVNLGPMYIVVLNEYKAMKEVLSHPGSLDRSADLVKHINPIGFSQENGKPWIEQRRFSMSVAREIGIGKENWGILIMEELSNLIKKLQELKGKPHVISRDLETSLTICILSLLIGRNLGKEEEDKLRLSMEFSHAVMSKLGPSNPTTLVPGLGKFCEIFKIAGYDKARKTIRQFQSFLKEEIKRRKTSPLFQDIPDFINAYLVKISEMQNSGIKDHTFTEYSLEGNLALLFLGASDTVYSSLSWIFPLMSKYKDVQEKIHTELMEVLGKDGRARYEERDKIPYTFAALMEVQRYASIVPLNATRKATQDIPVNGYIIPKGAEITTNLWGLHHDPDYWDEPEEFRPERFLIDGGTKLLKHPESYAPFSFGRRNCPGETIAWKELLYYTTEVLKKFEVTSPPGVETKFHFLNSLVSRLAPQPLCFKERNI